MSFAVRENKLRKNGFNVFVTLARSISTKLPANHLCEWNRGKENQNLNFLGEEPGLRQWNNKPIGLVRP